jgi:hypothetical protein
MKPMMHVWLKRVKDALSLPPAADVASKRVEYRSGGTGHVERMKLTLVSPPWPHVGEEVSFLGSRWLVTKTSGTRGTILALAKRRKADAAS